MPKKSRQNNQIASQNRDGSRTAATRHITGIGELLARQPLMKARAAQAAEQQPFFEWLRASLPGELAGHVVGLEKRSRDLVLSVDGAAWSARIRYALVALQSEIQQRHPDIQKVQVRVSPR